MIQLHADDAMGAAAHRAAQMVSRMDLRLLGAASMTLDRGARGENLTRFFAQWPKLCRAVAELERVAPNAARAGYEEDGKIVDFIEGKQVDGATQQTT